MSFIYNKSVIGYSHIESGLPCQDHSASYKDDNKMIITACDGHGGELYIRSDRGSRFASEACIEVLKHYTKDQIKLLLESDNLDKIKLEILCKWNSLVEEDISRESLNDQEMTKLNDEQIFRLKTNHVVAYGSTMNALMVVGDYLLCLQIGDGGIFLVNESGAYFAFDDDNENVANITQSLCGDKAFKNLNICLYDKNDYDGILMCTDGVLGPYQTYSNFTNNLIRPIFTIISEDLENRTERLDEFMCKLGKEMGNGDDVSLSIIKF